MSILSKPTSILLFSLIVWAKLVNAQHNGWLFCSIFPQFCPKVDPTPSPTVHLIDTVSSTPSPSKSQVEETTSSPSPQPIAQPTIHETVQPSVQQTSQPSVQQTSQPSVQQTSQPSVQQTSQPSNESTEEPNLIMIITDEHSIRTLGSYRDFFRSQGQDEQASIWGEGIEVETPNIDRLATEGALFTNFFTVAPLCTPSRASFMSGLYPQKTGETEMNHGRIDDDTVTFARVLKQNDYFTGYFGKWHLNGLDKPGWGNKTRKFGFLENKYQWNRGHWKFLDEVDEKMEAYEFSKRSRFVDREEEHFTTDYLFDRGIDFMETAMSRNQSFAYVLSIPDPHAPNENRAPYDTMYTNMTFKLPQTAYHALRHDPGLPTWNYHDHDAPLDDADLYLKEYEESDFYQSYMQQYFGMIKCIDDNVGKLLDFLDNNGLHNNTIVVFTSDHGNMAGEHGKEAKGRPYRTSAGIPFILRYPNRIEGGKVSRTARASIDFAPTILSLMNINHELEFDGSDFKDELSSSDNETNWKNIVFSFDTGRSSTWAAAMNRHLKLVVSSVDSPWLFDLDKDPYEIINYFDNPTYLSRKTHLLDALFNEINDHNIPLGNTTNHMYWSTPACTDSKDRIESEEKGVKLCKDLTPSSNLCSRTRYQNACPVACGICCTNSIDKDFWLEGELYQCQNLWFKCNKSKVQVFCPTTCKKQTNCTNDTL